jgi:D-cysteine desulfhydrase
MAATISFFSRPTPVEAADRLAGVIGLDAGRLLVKRDDLIGLGGGGNKARKLEVTIAAAVESGAGTVVTTGAPQSNHARLTAAAAARVGLRCVLVLEGHPPARLSGNLLLDELLGAEIVFAGSSTAADVASGEAQGPSTYLIPFGGSSAASADAYRVAGQELLDQVPDLSTVFVAVGSGGTMAGLVAALGTSRVIGVATGAVEDPCRVVSRFLAEMGHEPDGLQIDETQVGDGYEHLTAASREALTVTARTEGILLDPTYTARAMAGLIARARTRSLPAGPVVFLHTGGTPGLFGHPDLQH